MAKKRKPPFILRFIRWSFPKLEFLSPYLAKRLAVKLFFTPFKFPEPEREKQARMQSKQTSITVDGKKVVVYSWGSGTPVIFCHGWSGRGTQCFRFIKPLVSHGYALYSFDAPGHGQSEGKTSGIYEYQAAIAALVKLVGQPKALIGHSFGGIAAVFAKMNQVTNNKIITVSAPAVAPYIVEEFVNRIGGSTAIGNYFNSFVEKKYGRPFSDASIIEMVRKTGNFNLLMIHDQDDKEVPIRHLHQMKETHPWVEIYITHRLGHHKILKSPGVVDKCIDYLLAE